MLQILLGPISNQILASSRKEDIWKDQISNPGHNSVDISRFFLVFYQVGSCGTDVKTGLEPVNSLFWVQREQHNNPLQLKETAKTCDPNKV